MITLKRSLVAGAAAMAVGAIATLSIAPNALAGKDKDAAKVGEAAPDFTLTDINGTEHTLSTYTKEGKIVVLEWFNPTCPFVVKHHGKMDTMAKLSDKYEDEVVWLAINSAHKDHMTHAMKSGNIEIVKEWEIDYPVLVDADGVVGHAYGAKTTPHMYIIDTEGVLRYAGAIDSDKGAAPYNDKKMSKVTNYVDNALKQVIDGETVTQAETKAYGCSVKYKR